MSITNKTIKFIKQKGNCHPAKLFQGRSRQVFGGKSFLFVSILCASKKGGNGKSFEVRHVQSPRPARAI